MKILTFGEIMLRLKTPEHLRIVQANGFEASYGGAESNVAVSLARAGIGKLILMDFDRVDITNLHRQQYKVIQLGRPKVEAQAENLREIAP